MSTTESLDLGHALARAMFEHLGLPGATGGRSVPTDPFDVLVSGFPPELRGLIRRVRDLVGPAGDDAIKALVRDLYDEAYADGARDTEEGL